jgi:hypothetical protein
LSITDLAHGHESSAIVLLFRPAIRLDRGRAKAWLSLFENGFVMASGGTLAAARWDAMDEVRQNVARYSINGRYIRTSHRYVIRWAASRVPNLFVFLSLARNLSSSGQAR